MHPAVLECKTFDLKDIAKRTFDQQTALGKVLDRIERERCIGAVACFRVLPAEEGVIDEF
jgi:hypothetical protein